jgi:hypothetical protein
MGLPRSLFCNKCPIYMDKGLFLPEAGKTSSLPFQVQVPFKFKNEMSAVQP